MNTQTQHVVQPLSIYFAGDLWNHKDLIGNAILGSYIGRCSKGRYRCILPQDLEQATNRAVDIRNQDLGRVLSCDLGLFNFDGARLDDGTVVEFIYAKLLDVPCVLLRTDFRSAGDSDKDGDPWNRMVSNWPRTKVLKLHAMTEWQLATNSSVSLAQATRKLYTKYARAIIKCLDAVRSEPPNMPRDLLTPVYDWARLSPGDGFNQLFSEKDLSAIIAAKQARGLL